MADYYPLLTRALDALTERSPAMRRAVYDRARAALMDQLRNLEPPLSEGDIARERLALEDAVNRVESEQRRRESFADVISTAVLEPAGARPAPEPPPPLRRRPTRRPGRRSVRRRRCPIPPSRSANRPIAAGSASPGRASARASTPSRRGWRRAGAAAPRSSPRRLPSRSA